MKGMTRTDLLALATCPRCGGAKRITMVVVDSPTSGKAITEMCPLCGGTGTVLAGPPAPAQPPPGASAYQGGSVMLAEVQDWVAGLPPGWEGSGVLADLVMTCRRANRDGVRLAEAVTAELRKFDSRTAEAEAGKGGRP